jgi:hypothetical protein
VHRARHHRSWRAIPCELLAGSLDGLEHLAGADWFKAVVNRHQPKPEYRCVLLYISPIEESTKDTLPADKSRTGFTAQ